MGRVSIRPLINGLMRVHLVHRPLLRLIDQREEDMNTDILVDQGYLEERRGGSPSPNKGILIYFLFKKKTNLYSSSNHIFKILIIIIDN